MAERTAKLGPIGQAIIDITGPDPKGELIVHLCFGGGKGRTAHRFTGPNGTCIRLREAGHVEIQWGDDNYIAFGAVDGKWVIVEEQRDG